MSTPTARVAPLPNDKTALRRAMRALRRTLDPALGELLAAHLLDAGLLRAGAVLGGYWAIGGEIDVGPMLRAAASLGHAIALPVTPAEGAPLRFRRWRPGDTLRPGRLGTSEPVGDELRPDILLVPLLAFDRTGRRLGGGRGFYDRTLPLLPDALSIGCAFAAQEVDIVPTEPHDRPLRAIATEKGVFFPE